MLVTITRVINWSILFAFIACFSYQIVYLIAPYIKKEKTHKPLQMHRYAILIAARNEENVLGGLLDSIRAQNYPSELVDIYVVADNCTDTTAEIAYAHGAYVYERFNRVQIGKGYALKYLLDQISLSDNLEDYDGFFIFDADNLLDENYIKEIKGIKCGFLGYRSLSLSMNNEKGRQQIQEAINHLKNDEKCQLVFVYYHWGIERQYQANDDQRSLAKFTIDAGADAVIGSHPHVVQGTETYNGKPIVYSLGNFCFGGNRNPSDTDTMIYQLSYTFKGTNQLDYKVQIIPCSLTSSRGRNDYQPYILQGDEANRVMEKIKKYSY